MADNIEGGLIRPSPAATGQEPHHFRNVVIAWVVLSIIGIVVWIFVAPFFLPQVASNIDATDDLTIVMLTALAIPVALFFFVFLGYSVLFFRTREKPTEDPVPLKPRPGLQIGWLGFTGVLCLFLFIWGMVANYEETAAAVTPNTLIVNVTAQQWYWSFQYPQYGMSVQSQTIELPVNRPVKFTVTSEDVLHGFAIRSLGVRIDDVRAVFAAVAVRTERAAHQVVLRVRAVARTSGGISIMDEVAIAFVTARIEENRGCGPRPPRIFCGSIQDAALWPVAVVEHEPFA